MTIFTTICVRMIIHYSYHWLNSGGGQIILASYNGVFREGSMHSCLQTLCNNVIIIGIQNLAKSILQLEVPTKVQERYMDYTTVNGIQQGVSGTY